MSTRNTLERLKLDPLINTRHEFRAACALQALLTKHGHPYSVDLIGQFTHNGKLETYGGADGWLRILFVKDEDGEELADGYELDVFYTYMLIGALATESRDEHEYLIEEVLLCFLQAGMPHDGATPS